ncbi:MAG: phage late control D family protein [Desulfosudaceae bacterium]
MEKIARRAKIAVQYNGTDISADIAPMVGWLTCTDNASGKADDLEIELENRDGRWHGDWFPDKGAELTASIECENIPEIGKSMSYPCGVYVIDEIEVSSPPSKAVIRAVSANVKKSLRREDKTKAWENITLSAIVNEIAENHGLEAMYEAPDVEYNRKDQRKESDLAFLSRLAEDAAFRLKVAERKIILYSGEKFDAKDPVLTFTPEDIGKWRFTSEAHEVFSACRVAYWDPAEKITLNYTFEPKNGPESGQVLVVNERVESLAAAEKLAKAKLRQANQNEITGEIRGMGDPRLFAGSNISLSGFGVFSGKYFIEQVQHAYSPNDGYSTSASVRRAMEED